jgi:superfamily II DNA or RNA helicase
LKTRLNPVATLGLSATPERPYDEGLEEVLIPKLGKIIYRYTYKDALRDKVIVPFELKNVVFELEPERQAEYDKLTKAIGRAINNNGMEDERTVALLLKRARVMNLSVNRIRLALRLVLAHKGSRTIVFHEDIEACNVIQEVLAEAKVRSGVYHSKMNLRHRAETLSAYPTGSSSVRGGLDEFFDQRDSDYCTLAFIHSNARQFSIIICWNWGPP